jgi:hypothetical protein
MVPFRIFIYFLRAAQNKSQFWLLLLKSGELKMKEKKPSAGK